MSDHFDAIRLDAKRYRPYSNRGYAYELLRRRASAISDFRKVLQLKPNHRGATRALKAPSMPRLTVTLSVSHARRAVERMFDPPAEPSPPPSPAEDARSLQPAARGDRPPSAGEPIAAAVP